MYVQQSIFTYIFYNPSIYIDNIIYILIKIQNHIKKDYTKFNLNIVLNIKY